MWQPLARPAPADEILPQRPGDRRSTNVPAWELSTPQRRLAVPTRPELLNDVEHRDRTHHGHPLRDARKEQNIFGTSSDRDHAEQKRRQQALSERRQAAADRVLQYATEPKEYQQQARAEVRVALDAHVQASQQARDREQRARTQQDRQALAHAAAQEQGIQQRVDARKAAQQQVAAEQRAQIEAKQAAAQAARRSDHAASGQTGFFDRFGTSLA